jgi:hypothetical protein
MESKDPALANLTDKKTPMGNKHREYMEALVSSFGVITTAALSVGVHRQTHYDWCRDVEGFKEAAQKAIELGEESGLDFAESKLFQKIRNEDLGGICFYLKCKGKKRGYIERSEVALSGAVDVSLEKLSEEQLKKIAQGNPDD